jgi:hypothetical protein
VQQKVDLIALRSNDAEYKRIAEFFSTTLQEKSPLYSVTQIEKNTNAHLVDNYQNEKFFITLTNKDGNANEKLCFHACKEYLHLHASH